LYNSFLFCYHDDKANYQSPQKAFIITKRKINPRNMPITPSTGVIARAPIDIIIIMMATV